jgi:hypothetical protein
MDILSQNLKSLPASVLTLRDLLRLVTKSLHCLDFAHGVRFGYVSFIFYVHGRRYLHPGGTRNLLPYDQKGHAEL